MTYLVRRIAPGEWRELRAIRLEAVRDTPTAFSSSHAELAALPDAFWQAETAPADTEATFVAADETGDWVGSAGVGPLFEVPGHAHLHAVYVRAAHRGPTGPGARLVTAAIRFAEQHIDVAHLTLGVHEANARALAFYRRLGFHPTGKVIPYRPNPAARVRILEYREFKMLAADVGRVVVQREAGGQPGFDAADHVGGSGEADAAEAFGGQA